MWRFLKGGAVLGGLRIAPSQALVAGERYGLFGDMRLSIVVFCSGSRTSELEIGLLYTYQGMFRVEQGWTRVGVSDECRGFLEGCVLLLKVETFRA